jgi:hypothetical protein
VANLLAGFQRERDGVTVSRDFGKFDETHQLKMRPIAPWKLRNRYQRATSTLATAAWKSTAGMFDAADLRVDSSGATAPA